MKHNTCCVTVTMKKKSTDSCFWKSLFVDEKTGEHKGATGKSYFVVQLPFLSQRSGDEAFLAGADDRP